MFADYTGLLFGAVGGGIVALVFRVIETHWIAPTFTESREVHKALLRYAMPLAVSCDDAEYRMDRILKEAGRGEIPPLTWSPRNAKSLDWFTRDGYYITSTAYLIASVLAWIVLFQRNVVFLRFRRKSVTTEFFERIRDLKVKLSSGTSLYYYNLDGIGEKLIPEGADRPMPLSAFCERLLNDPAFLQYYGFLFDFLHGIGRGQYILEWGAVLRSMREVKSFLQRHGAVPDITLEERVATR